MEFTQEHEGIRRTVKQFIDAEINPHVDAWEEAGIFPAHELFKKLGDLGFLGVNKPDQVRRHGPRLLLPAGVRRRRSATSTAAACRWRSACRPTWRRRRSRASAPTSCARSSSRPRSPATTSPASACPRSAPAPTSPRSRPPRARTAATTSSTAARCGSPTARRPTGCACSPTPATGPLHKNKSLICVPMKTKGVQHRPQARQARHALLRHGADLLRGRARAAALPHRRGGHGLHLPDAAVPGGAAVCGGRRPRRHGAHDRRHHRLHPRAQGLRPADPRQPGRALPPGRAARPRSRRCAR